MGRTEVVYRAVESRRKMIPLHELAGNTVNIGFHSSGDPPIDQSAFVSRGKQYTVLGYYMSVIANNVFAKGLSKANGPAQQAAAGKKQLYRVEGCADVMCESCFCSKLCRIPKHLPPPLQTRLNAANSGKTAAIARLDVANLLDKVVELLLGVGVLLGHLLVLGFPLIARLLESLDFAFVVAGLNVGLAEPRGVASQHT